VSVTVAPLEQAEGIALRQAGSQMKKGAMLIPFATKKGLSSN
jgi:hypothetical protein